MSRKYLEPGWKDFERRCVHEDAGDVQRRSMRQAFYAGALVVFATLESQVSQGDEITDADMDLMATIDAELRAFATELKRLAEASRKRGQG
jgi:hypothetical protein